MNIAAPNIAAITAAIRRIKSGAHTFTCLALEAALTASRREHSRKELTDYWWAYRISCTNAHGGLPHWWNSDLRNVDARVAALKKFRRECIAAAKRQQAQQDQVE